jgi:hypothetical protein
VNPLNLLLGLPGPSLSALAFAAGLALAGPAAWYVGRLPLQAELADMAATDAKQKFLVAERTAAVLQAASARGDALSTTLAKAQSQIDQLNRSRRDALPKVTTGRTCLDGPALRLLNGAPGLSVSGFAATAGSIAAAGGTVAADPDSEAGLISSDQDIAGWAIDAGAAFEVCRTRLDALIDWHTPPEDKQP